MKPDKILMLVTLLALTVELQSKPLVTTQSDTSDYVTIKNSSGIKLTGESGWVRSSDHKITAVLSIQLDGHDQRRFRSLPGYKINYVNLHPVGKGDAVKVKGIEGKHVYGNKFLEVTLSNNELQVAKYKDGKDYKAAQSAIVTPIATPLAGPNPVVNGAAPVAEVASNNYYNNAPIASTPFVGPNPIIAPVTQTKADKKAARKAARNAATPLVGPNPVINGAAPVAEVVNNNYYNPPVAAAVAGPSQVLAPVAQTKADKKAARRAARNAATPLVGPNPVVNGAAPVAEVVNNNYYAAPVASAVAGPNPLANGATPLVGPNPAARIVANNNSLAIRREQMLAAQQQALNNGPANNYPYNN